jgi:hypothetical protein
VTIRFGLILAMLALAGCSRHDDSAADARPIDCVLAGVPSQCKVETVIEGDRKLLVVRHPDGGFRRFEAVSDGRGVVPADGAQGAGGNWTNDGGYAVSVGQDRYVFPARELPTNAPGN